MAVYIATKPSEHAGGFTQMVGSTVFNVNVFFNTGKTETVEEKLLRIMKKGLTNARFCGTIKVPQADLPSERGSV